LSTLANASADVVTTEAFSKDVAIIGGGGHIGLPLALMFADIGCKTHIFDINAQTIEKIRSGVMPFSEEDGPATLKRVLATDRLSLSTTPEGLEHCRVVIMIVGTPIDEHLNPSLNAINKAIAGCIQHLRNGQIMILRSTVFPGVSRQIQNYFDESGLKIDVAFCPERAAQGYSFREFRTLPQIISAFKPDVLKAVRELFSGFTCEFVEMEPMEAELTKLMTNAWRYIQFATVNQFYMIATKHGLNFERILHGCRHKYPRMENLPGPGLAAGPCLVKDTMQLASFSQNQFVLGHSAMLINEGLPAYLIDMAKTELLARGRRLSDCVAGILGMAFKAESDDPRDSLSYKLRKFLTFEAKGVLCTDPRIADPSFVPLQQLIHQADVLFVGTPHKCYRGMSVPENKLVIDVWNCLANRAQAGK
jgi:UDP-N-acetyl-D-mannosaminuronic acid dehydrogenase